jgi:hypothetical protein
MLYVAAGAATRAVESMRLLIDAGADVRVIDDAVAHGANATVFPLLRSLGVNLNAVDDKGNTPFHSARDVAAMVALFAHGAATAAKNNANLTPFEAFSHGARRLPVGRVSVARNASWSRRAGLGFDLKVDSLSLATVQLPIVVRDSMKSVALCPLAATRRKRSNRWQIVGVHFRTNRRACFVCAPFRCVSDCSRCA